MTHTERHAAAAEFWQAFQTAWVEAGRPSAPDIHHLMSKHTRDEIPPESTIRGWLKLLDKPLDTRSLPRDVHKVEFMFRVLADDATGERIGDLLHEARRAPVAPPATDPPETPARSRRWPPRAVVGAAALVLVAVGTAAAVFWPEGASGAGPDTAAAGSTPPTPVPQDAGAGASSRVPLVPLVRAGNGAASAEFYRDPAEFLLADDRSDNKSAILVLKVNGQVLPPYYNSDAMMTRDPSGARVRNPPRAIGVPVSRGDHAEFRVCSGDRGKPVPEDTCSDWTRIPPL